MGRGARFAVWGHACSDKVVCSLKIVVAQIQHSIFPLQLMFDLIKER